jgi:hypothetical protein
MASTLNQFLAAGLNAGAAYLTTEKPKILSYVTTPIDNTLDSGATAVKNAVNSIHGFAGSLIDPLIDGAVDSLDAQGKAAAPKEAGALIDFFAAAATAEATRLLAS